MTDRSWTITVLKATTAGAGGLLLGWIFWRKGLACSIISHCAANGVHLLLMPALFTLSA